MEGKKNDKKDNKTRWELMPLDCLEDIARVYTEGAKKYADNSWQNLENGYERYKGALLRHLYAAETKTFDEETGCRHLAQVAWNAIALLWISKHRWDIDKNLSTTEEKVNEEVPFEEIITLMGDTKTVEDFNHGGNSAICSVTLPKDSKVNDIEEVFKVVDNGETLEAYGLSSIIKYNNNYYLVERSCITDRICDMEIITKKQADILIEKWDELRRQDRPNTSESITDSESITPDSEQSE